MMLLQQVVYLFTFFKIKFFVGEELAIFNSLKIRLAIKDKKFATNIIALTEMKNAQLLNLKQAVKT